MNFRNSFILTILLLTCAYCVKAQCNDNVVRKCVYTLGEYTFLKVYNIAFEKDRSNKTMRFSYVFSKGNRYKITSCSEYNSEVNMVVSLFDNQNSYLASTYNDNNSKHYPGFIFECNKTGVYSIDFESYEGKIGCGVSLIGMLVR